MIAGKAREREALCTLSFPNNLVSKIRRAKDRVE
jgi:hypothetical protein